MFHTSDCLKSNLKYEEFYKDWIHRYPNYCASCGGWGATVVVGCSVPYGNTSVNLPDEVDICPDCLEQGICPRCGEHSMVDQDSDAEHCTSCGWVNGDSGLPEPPECYCFFHPRNNPEE